MPKILDKLVSQLKAKGVDNPWAVAVASQQKAGNLRKGSTEATKQGIRRGNMTPREREKARDARAKH